MAVTACASAIAAPTGSAFEQTSSSRDSNGRALEYTIADTKIRLVIEASADAGFAQADGTRSLVEELRMVDDSAHSKREMRPAARVEARALQETSALAAVSGSLSADLLSDPPVTSVAPPAEIGPPTSAANATVSPGESSSAPPVTPEPIATVPVPAVPNPTVPAPIPTIPTPPPTSTSTPAPAPTPPAATPESTPEPTLTPNPTPEPTDGPATPTPSSETPTPEPSEEETTPAPPSSTPTNDTPKPTPAPQSASTPTPKPNIIMDIQIEDETNPPKKYTRNSEKNSPAATTATGSKQSGAAEQEDRSDSSSEEETSTTTTNQEKVIGGRTRDNPVNAVTMSKDLVEFHDVVRYTTCTFAGISVALLLFFHYVSLDPSVDWSSALLWSPNTWEFVLYLGYLQQMGSLSQLNLAFTPYFLWDFTDSFSWSLFLVHHSDAAVTTRRLDAVVLAGVVAFGDRIGIEETNLLFICSLAFLLVFGVLFAVYVALVLFAKRKAEDKFDVIVDNYSIIDPSQVRDGVFELRIVSLRFLGLCVLIWLFALYPLSLFASFEISMQIDSDSISFGSLVLAIVVLGLVCLAVLVQSARELYDKSERELADVKNLALWGSLYAAYTYRRRLFFLVVVFVQIGSGVLIGAMTTSASPTVLLVAVLVLQVAYLAAVFFQAGFISLSVGLFTFALSVVKIANYALAFAFLEASNQSSTVRTRVANAFILINSVVLIAWFVRHAIMFVLTLRALSQRKSESHPHSSDNANNDRRQQQQQYPHSEDEDEDELPPEMVEFQTPMERGTTGNGAAGASANATTTASGNNANYNSLEPKVSNLSDSQLSLRGSNVFVTMVVSPARERGLSSHTTGSSASPPPTRGTIKMALPHCSPKEQAPPTSQARPENAREKDDAMPPMRWTPLAVQGATPTIKNHSATVISRHEILVFGGYDGRRNHNELYVFDCRSYTWRELFASRDVRGTPPAGRNGHTATLADGNKVFIIGGWLGSGPLAADDLHVLDIERWEWNQPSVKGVGPGPCNMHTADYLPHLRSILLFRGGDGREYLNDLHALNIDLMEWRKIHATGEVPAPRANHSSAVVGSQVLVFGGWDGQKRLNDIHLLDTDTFTWSRADVKSPLPHPRAGMTFSCHKDRIFLFGGSGPSAKCYNDLHIYEPYEQVWMETLQLPADNDRNPNGTEEEDMGGVTLTPQQLVDYGMYGDGDANPNDNPHHDQIVIFGNGPGRRAGHSCSVVDRKLFVFGGSYGSEYLNDFYVLDTDPPPRAAISYASSTQTLQQSLKYFMNSEEFSDISFLVEGRVVYAHKVILSLLSERFRGMFTAGFRESSQKEIALPDIRYVVFLKMIEYLYTGHAVEGVTHRSSPTSHSRREKTRPNQLKTAAEQHGRWSSFHPSNERDVRAARSYLAYVDDEDEECVDEEEEEEYDDDEEDDEDFIGSTGDLDTTLDLLVLADQFMLDHLKQICERALQYSVTDETVDYILDAADRSNALQLKAICMHFLRNQDAASRYTYHTYEHQHDQDPDAYPLDQRRHSIE